MPRRLSFLLPALLLAACIQVNIPSDFHGTLDVNLRVDKALDDLFGDLDKQSTTIKHSTPANP